MDGGPSLVEGVGVETGAESRAGAGVAVVVGFASGVGTEVWPFSSGVVSPAAGLR